MINIDLIRGLCVPNKGLGGYDLVNLKAHLEQPPNSNKGLFWDPPKLIGAQAIVRVGTVFISRVFTIQKVVWAITTDNCQIMSSQLSYCTNMSILGNIRLLTGCDSVVW